MAAANKEQGRILREAMEERDKIVHEARKQAEIAAQKELDAVKQQIQMEKDEAIRDIRRQVAVLSVDIAEKVLRKSLEDKDAQMGMIDRCDSLGKSHTNNIPEKFGLKCLNIPIYHLIHSKRLGRRHFSDRNILNMPGT